MKGLQLIVFPQQWQVNISADTYKTNSSTINLYSESKKNKNIIIILLILTSATIVLWSLS